MIPIAEQIKTLAAEKHAVILAHNYQVPEVQDVADFVGDSLGLALEAQRTDAERIIFCGVHFMAESAKILNPEKTVLLPNLSAGCALADSITPESLEEWLDRYPGYAVVTYVNSSAEINSARIDQLIDEVFLRTVSRPSTGEEMQQARADIAKAGDSISGVRDLLWVMLNTREFTVNH